MQQGQSPIEHLFNCHTWCDAEWCWAKQLDDATHKMMTNTMKEKVCFLLTNNLSCVASSFNTILSVYFPILSKHISTCPNKMILIPMIQMIVLIPITVQILVFIHNNLQLIMSCNQAKIRIYLMTHCL